MWWDETGLNGKYDFRLRYAGNGQIGDRLQPDGVRMPAGGVRDVSDPVGPSLFNAMEKQLGLRLVRRKMVLDSFIVDHVERIPIGN